MSAGCYDKRERGTKLNMSTVGDPIVLNQMVQGEVKSFAPLVANLPSLSCLDARVGCLTSWNLRWRGNEQARVNHQVGK